MKPVNLKEIEIPQTYEEILDEAEIFGIMMGDGYCGNYLIRLKVKDLDFCQHFSNLITRTYGIYAPIKKRDYYACFAHSALLAKRVAKLTKNNFRIPEFILKGDKFIKARFIRGFSDAEGSVDVIYNRRQIVITQKNIPMLEQIKQLLLDLDIQSKVVIKKFGMGKLIISLLRNLELYQEYIGFMMFLVVKKEVVMPIKN